MADLADLEPYLTAIHNTISEMVGPDHVPEIRTVAHDAEIRSLAEQVAEREAIFGEMWENAIRFALESGTT